MVKAKRPESSQEIHSNAVRRALDDNGDELIWIAAVMTGGRQAGEQCLLEAIELAESARSVGPEWMLSWLKRLLVHVALKRTSDEIREFWSRGIAQCSVEWEISPANAYGRERLRSIPPQRIIASFDVLERSCFILHAYLEYPVLDCALLLGCPRASILNICARVLANLEEASPSIRSGFRDAGVFISPGVAECTG